jgi:CRISPR-associated endoribonuclease Cas6
MNLVAPQADHASEIAQASATMLALMIKLRPVAKGDIVPHAGQLAHAALLRWLAEVQPEVAERLHAPNGERPFTCSSLWFPNEQAVAQAQQENRRLPIVPDLTYWLRLTVLDEQVFRVFARRFLPGQVTAVGEPLALPQMRLGSVRFDVMELRVIDSTPAPAHTVAWCGYTTYHDLVRQARELPAAEQEAVGLEFRSPTAFSDGQQAWGKRMHLFPDPERVFLRLARVWNAWAPPDLALDLPALRDFVAACVVPAHYALETRVLHFDRHTQVGFVGRCHYALFPPADPSSVGAELTPAQAVQLLARFAFYAGIGQKTTMGMGQARPLIAPRKEVIP